jgi:hypothetical protein
VRYDHEAHRDSAEEQAERRAEDRLEEKTDEGNWRLDGATQNYPQGWHE